MRVCEHGGDPNFCVYCYEEFPMRKERCVLLEAAKEFEAEKFREAVEAEKERLRKKVPLLHRLFPWQLKLIRRAAC